MIRKVSIENYKSVQALELDLGRVNVFIGENGCGKTSILEGIALGSAAAQNKLDDEFLVSRGIRVLSPELMRSAFNESNLSKDIAIIFERDDNKEIPYFLLKNENGLNSKWVVEGVDMSFLNDKEGSVIEMIKELSLLLEASKEDDLQKTLSKTEDNSSNQINDYLRSSASILGRLQKYKVTIQDLAPFLIFAPENYFLRRFEEEGQIRPLGIRGEGLFRHLTELAKENPETIKTISEQLKLIDWFEGLEIPDDLSFSERRINITDRFIQDTIKHFDQRSANEGFLYLLFYFTLFLSKYTPHFFAIDNIDNALNPKLCAKLTSILCKLAAENEKQVILTTHNPAILDGLDLKDEEQRLFVIYRNADGETMARRVKAPEEVEGVEPVRLSEAFVRGYLGGLPKNF
ncbi:AAA family ATPase [Chitinophagaceae bacterium MMS25-I14]